MVSTNRIKNIDGDEYEDDFADDVADDFAEEEQEEELTEEDLEKMNEGTRAVREALGEYSANVSTKDIQDDLWHYWYDVDKVVLHILNVKAKNEAKQAKQAQHAAQNDPITYDYPILMQPRHETPKELFADCSWLHIPAWRKAEITIEPTHLRGGLLGGSGAAPKKSKLAALAAARRKENATAASAVQEGVSSSVSLLDKLSLQKEPSGGLPSKRPSDQPSAEPQRPRKYPVRPRVQEPEPKPQPESEESDDEQGPPVDTVPAQLAPPSAFASVLVGSTPKSDGVKNAQPAIFAPYQYPMDLNQNPFEGPSPDDIVLQAQQGSKALNKNTPKK